MLEAADASKRLVIDVEGFEYVSGQVAFCASIMTHTTKLIRSSHCSASSDSFNTLGQCLESLSARAVYDTTAYHQQPFPECLSAQRQSSRSDLKPQSLWVPLPHSMLMTGRIFFFFPFSNCAIKIIKIDQDWESTSGKTEPILSSLLIRRRAMGFLMGWIRRLRMMSWVKRGIIRRCRRS